MRSGRLTVRLCTQSRSPTRARMMDHLAGCQSIVTTPVSDARPVGPGAQPPTGSWLRNARHTGHQRTTPGHQRTTHGAPGRDTRAGGLDMRYPGGRDDVQVGVVRPELRIGPYRVDPPVVLAPMAGITNVAFRRLCREFGAGLFVCEMITSRALIERHPGTLKMISFDAVERPRSMQLYGVDPATIRKAVEM